VLIPGPPPGLDGYWPEAELESRLLRRLMYQLYQPPNIAAARTATATPTPMPALAPVERPPPDEAEFEAGTVLVFGETCIAVVTGVVATTTEVRVV